MRLGFIASLSAAVIVGGLACFAGGGSHSDAVPPVAATVVAGASSAPAGLNAASPAPQPVGAATRPVCERADLLARDVLWQALPSDVREVTIDRTGRAWFELQGEATIEQIKAQVERSVSLRAPYVVAAKIMLHGSRKRIWLLPRRQSELLLGYDPASGKWIERRCLPVEKDSAETAGFDANAAGFESSKGIVYFADRRGVHVFDGRDWSYQGLYELTLKHDLWCSTWSRAFDRPRFVQDDRGNVTVWSWWGDRGRTGTVGAFIHDGAGWRQRILADYHSQLDADGKALPHGQRPSKDLNRFNHVVPLDDDRLLVVGEYERAYIVCTTDANDAMRQAAAKDISLLGAEDYAVRQAANDRLAAMGRRIEPQLREAAEKSDDPEVRTRAGVLLDKWRPSAGVVLGGMRVTTLTPIGRDCRGNTWCYVRGIAASAPADEKVDDRPRPILRRLSPDGSLLPAPAGVCGDPVLVSSGPRRTWLYGLQTGVFCLDGNDVTRITGDSECLFGRIAWLSDEDASGRIFLDNGIQKWAYHAGKPDGRKALATELDANQMGMVNSVQVNSRGLLTAQVDRRIKRWEDGAWQDLGAPREVGEPFTCRWMQPLHDNGLIAVTGDYPYSVALGLFDGQKWTSGVGLRKLIEKNPELAKRIDNRRPGSEYNELATILRVDAKGRIWLAEWKSFGVFDGNSWIDVYAAMKKRNLPVDARATVMLPVPGQDAMLVHVGQWYEMSAAGGRIAIEARGQIGAASMDGDEAIRSSLWIDRQGRLLIPQDRGPSFVVDDKGIRKLDRGGCPRFADSRNRVYLTGEPDVPEATDEYWGNPHWGVRRTLRVVDSAGRWAELKMEGLPRAARMCEDGRGFIWVSTTRGLAQLAVDDAPAGLSLRQVALYDKDVPMSRCFGMWIDQQQKLLWLGCDSGNRAMLYHITLPK